MSVADCTPHAERAPLLIDFPGKRPREDPPAQVSPALAVRGRRRDWQPYAGPNYAQRWLDTCSEGFPDNYVVEIGPHCMWVNLYDRRSGQAVFRIERDGTRLLWAADPQRTAPCVVQRKVINRFSPKGLTAFDQPATVRKSSGAPNAPTAQHGTGHAAPPPRASDRDNFPVGILCCVGGSARRPGKPGVKVQRSLQAKRNELGLTQENVAAAIVALGKPRTPTLSRQMVSQIEGGRSGRNINNLLKAYCDVLYAEAERQNTRGSRHNLADFTPYALCPDDFTAVAA